MAFLLFHQNGLTSFYIAEWYKFGMVWKHLCKKGREEKETPLGWSLTFLFLLSIPAAWASLP